MWDVMTRPGVLVLLCAAGYASATVAMKTASTTPGLVIGVVIFACLAGAVLAEVLLLQRTHLGLAYVAILALETVLVLTLAACMGETLAPREWAGAALVLAGAAVLTV